MPTLFSRLSAETVRIYCLVLSASGISYQVRQNHHFWSIEVPADDRSAACNAIAKYLVENAQRPAREGRRFLPKGQKTWSALYALVPLVVIHWGMGNAEDMRASVAAFGAAADQITAGGYYRCVTALMLHIGWGHLLGNVVGLALFGTALSAFWGWGMGWLAILLCGAAGNGLTAMWYGSGHVSVGASTAVFAAVGLCAAVSFWRGRLSRSWSWRLLTPLAGGVALLSFLGAAPHADLVAHLMGFTTGLAAGLIGGWQTNLPAWPIQLSAAFLAASLVILSWVWGLGYKG